MAVEGAAGYQYDFVSYSTPTATEATQGLRDSGGASLQLTACEDQIFLPCQDGPGRLPCTLVRVIVSGLPADLLVPGVVQTLLQCAGYTLGGVNGVILQAEHGGELKAALAAFRPDVMRLGVVVGIGRPPSADTTL